MNKEYSTINAIHVGVSGFPYGSAPINRCLFIYRSLVEKSVNFLFINNKAVHKEDIPIELNKKGNYEGINYTYTSLSQYKPDSFIKKRISNFWGIINEILLIFKLKFTNKLDVAFYYPDGKLSKLFYYRFLSIILHFPIISHYVEYRTAFESREKKKLQHLRDSFFDKRFTCFVDAVLPISEFLINRLKESTCQKPYLKVPPQTDFSIFNKHISKDKKYFLYCGSAAYLEAYKFVISSFNKVNSENYFLHLVINGNDTQINLLNELINKNPKSKFIIHYQNLKYEDLINQYCNANALLIPLSSSIQDKARFPQKISEYLASGNPIITTNYGEIKHYFKNFDNALIAETYDQVEYSKLMNYVIENPEEVKKIGKKGLEIGYNHFHYKNIDLINFIKEVM